MRLVYYLRVRENEHDSLTEHRFRFTNKRKAEARRKSAEDHGFHATVVPVMAKEA